MDNQTSVKIFNAGITHLNFKEADAIHHKQME